MKENLHTCYSESSSSSSSQEEEEEYINMEVDHHSSFNRSIFSQSTNKEFEFQSFSSSSDRDNHTTTSPADELFYMGKLLPLHLPPRLEMVHKILQKPDSQKYESDEPFSTPLFTPSSNTPFESCNISPSDSRHVSRELDPNEYLSEYFSGFQEKPTWTNKNLKMIKQSSSKKWTSYLKSFFTKSSGCSDPHYASAADQPCVHNSHCKTAKINSAPFGQIKYKNDINLVEDHRGSGGHRRSFSGAFKRLSKPKAAAAAASSTNSNSVNLNRNAFKKSIGSEMDSPIQAAIAHCKRSQRVVHTLY